MDASDARPNGTPAPRDRLPVLIALLPFLGWLSFLLLAARRRSPRWLVVALGYAAVSAAALLLFSLAEETAPGQYENRWAVGAGAFLLFGGWIGAAVHAIHASRPSEVGPRAEVAPTPPPAGASTPSPPAPGIPPHAFGPSTAVANLPKLDARRVGARLIDLLLLVAVSELVVAVLGEGVNQWLFLVWLGVAYFYVCEATTGQTLGKRLLKLRVVKRDGTPPDAGAIARRNVLRILEEPLIALIAIASSRRRRQRLGDLAAGTTVGRALGSSPPNPSRMRFVYPLFWAVCGVGFALLLAGADEQRPRAQATAFYAGTGSAYKEELRSICVDHNRQIAAASLSPAQILAAEREFSRSLAAVPAPPALEPLRRRILAARRSVDRVTAWFVRRWNASDTPHLTYRRELGPRVRQVVLASWAPFELAGIDCSQAPQGGS